MTIYAVLQAAVAAHQAGELKEAVRLYGEVLGKQPSNAVANYNLGVLSLGIQDLETAIILFKNAVDSNPDEKQYWLSYIDALKRDGQIEKAEEVNEERLWYLNREGSEVVEHKNDPTNPIE